MRKRQSSATVGQAKLSPVYKAVAYDQAFIWRETMRSLLVRLGVAWILLFCSAVLVFYRGPEAALGKFPSMLFGSDFLPNVTFVVVTVVMAIWSSLRTRSLRVRSIRWAYLGLTAPFVLVLVSSIYDYDVRTGYQTVITPGQVYTVRLHQAAVPWFGYLDDLSQFGTAFPMLLAVPGIFRHLSIKYVLPDIIKAFGVIIWFPLFVALSRCAAGRVTLIGLHGLGLLMAMFLMMSSSSLFFELQFVYVEALTSYVFFPVAAAAAFVRALVILSVTAIAVEFSRLTGFPKSVQASAF